MQSGTFAGLPLTNASVGVPLNADRAYVLGVELNAQIQLGFLPSFLSGFGVGGNVTFVKSKVSGLPARTDTVTLFNQSGVVGTAQVYYEKDRLSARVAYSYRSHYLANVGTSAAFDGLCRQLRPARCPRRLSAREGSDDLHRGQQSQQRAFPAVFQGVQFPIENERYGYSVRGGIQLSF